MKIRPAAVSLVLSFFLGEAIASPSVQRVAQPPADLKPINGPFHGRARQNGPNTLRYQWPGTYAEALIQGTEVFFHVGTERVILHVFVDGTEIAELVKPEAGLYQVSDLPAGRHVVRLESASENQAGPITFGGFAIRSPNKSLTLTPRRHQIEFIGDSHTVGYGDTSPKRECTEDEVWSTTDTSQAYGPIVAKHFDADYQVNAISGRGIVRNYNGFKADPLPVIYPFVLFDEAQRYENPKWQPQVIVIALGTNDFSTALNAGESWASREALHADYEAKYLQFLQALRARHRQALLVLWASDMADGEIQTEVKKVVADFTAKGDKRTVFVPVNALELTGCNWHPSLKDQRTTADAVIQAIEAGKKDWNSH